MQDEEWLSRRYYGGDLPIEAERALHEAALDFSNESLAEQHVHRALQLAPGHLAVLIGAYKFYFYHHRLTEALPYAEACLAEAGRRLALPADWRAVRPSQADFASLEGWPRLFLFSLVALGYLLLRLGRVAEGEEALTQVVALDPGDRLGARALLTVVHGAGSDDD
ncbi:hypothetical protein [Telmatospirillum sp.]|uniref:hypothetical protein n=1 Tax=Telmatospirillum sp. TaxID=2079197 RepID=UPI0028422AFD|nr:hypothetical protein [Telmatospirillum sp.]MDR3438621.1 hypothetical protein [Telmatospirillum sp.]